VKIVLSGSAHNLEIRNSAGVSLYTTGIRAEDGQEIQALWQDGIFQLSSPGAFLVAEGDHLYSTEPGVSPFTEADATADPVPETPVDADADMETRDVYWEDVAPPEPQSTTSAASSSTTSSGDGGVMRDIAITAAGAATRNSTLGSAVVSSIANNSAPASSGGLISNSPAGFNRASTSRSPNYIKSEPAAITGEVRLQNTDGYYVEIYVDGMLAVVMEPGINQASIEIEVGQRQVEFWDAASRTVKYRGELQVNEHYPVDVRFSSSDQPVSTNRSWAWVDR